MARAVIKILLITTLSLLPMSSFGVQTLKLRHMLSVYLDERGVGLQQPEGVACDDKSYLVVADTGNGRLVQYVYQNRALQAQAAIKIPQLIKPSRVQINSKGEILVLDSKQLRIIILDPEGGFKGYLNPQGLPSPTTYIPKGFSIDRNDNIHILDVFSGRVLVLDPGGRYQKHIKFPDKYGFISDLTVDSNGNIFMIDSINATVFSAAKGSSSFSPLTKNLKEYMKLPTNLTVDNRGRIYIVDRTEGNIVILGPDGSYLGKQLSLGWKEGLLYYPSQICVNDKGEVFIADRGNNRVQIFKVVE